jgi:hypothetical protein
MISRMTMMIAVPRPMYMWVSFVGLAEAVTSRYPAEASSNRGAGDGEARP